MGEGDARFADGDPARRQSLALKADDAEGLAVISALLQDAVGRTSEIAWMPNRHRFAMVVSRFRWEDANRAAARGGEFERVRAGLHADNVLRVQAKGFDPEKAQQVFELLSIAFEPGDEGGGTILLTCAGDACFALEVEALDLCMHDLGGIWKTDIRPEHPEATE